MSAPAKTLERFVPWGQSGGGDLVTDAGDPDSVLRLWLTGEAFPRIVLDIQNNAVLTGNGTAAPTAISGGGGGGISTTLASGSIIVGNGSNVATAVAMSGDVTIDNAGATTIGNNKVTNAMISAPVLVTRGGTGATAFTAHGVMIGSGTSALVSTSAGTTGQALVSQGASADPAFGTLPPGGGGTGLTAPTAHAVLIGAGASNIALAAPGSTGIPLVSTGASTDPAFGTATVPGGGTGATTLTSHGVLLGQGAGAVTATAAGTVGQVLKSGGASADPSYISWPHQTMVFSVGRYYAPFAGNGATGTKTIGDFQAIPFAITATTTFDRIGVNVTTGAASALLRLGIYNDVGGKPSGAPLLDAGTIDASGTGDKVITISQQLTPGLYWLACLAEGANGAAYRTGATSYFQTGNTTLGGDEYATPGWDTTGITPGSLPTTPTVTNANGISTFPRIGLRVASIP